MNDKSDNKERIDNRIGIDNVLKPALEDSEIRSIVKMIDAAPDKIVLSNVVLKTYEYKKTVISKYYKKDKLAYQIERFTDKQAFHENVEIKELKEAVLSMFPDHYKQLNAFSKSMEWDFKVTKKGKLLCNTRKMQDTADVLKRNEKSGKDDVEGVGRISYGGSCGDSALLKTHNRKKNYILKEGDIIPPLIDLGIFTKDGKVVNSMYDKYKQINRFIELVDDVIKNYRKRTSFNIIDFGCGKSYLTFILYYYLVELKGMDVTITGLDLKADVIDKCNATAKKYHYDNLHFEIGDINGYKTDAPVDMVITLHACDTATDFALYNAICWKAGIILSVPCCQHELNGQIKSDDYSILTRYGIVKERVSALMTDAIRANVLEYCGYNTQLLEFIDIAHSPKNILMRAMRRDNAGNRGQREVRAWDEASRLCKEFNIKQTLMELVRT